MSTTFNLTPQEIEYFWNKVTRVAPEACWEWQGTRSKNGYGVFRVQKITMYAHRVAFFLTNGPISQPCICHHCDNRPCCNPNHLFAGTVKDNAQDALKKGRLIIPRKLTSSQVLEIFRLLQTGMFHKDIAKIMQVSGTTIWEINIGRTWKDLRPASFIPQPRYMNRNRGNAHWNTKLSDDDVQIIRALRRQGHMLLTIAAQFNTTKTTISRIVLHKSR